MNSLFSKGLLSLLPLVWFISVSLLTLPTPSVLILAFDTMPGLSDLVSLRPNGNAGKVTLSTFESHHDPAAVISPVDVTAAPGAMTFSDDIHNDYFSLKNGSGSDTTFDPSRNAKKETEQRILPVTVIAHDLILTIVNSVAPRDFMSDGFDRFVLDTSNEISAFLDEANIGLSPDTEKRSLMNEAFILTKRSSVVATDAKDTRNEAANPNHETVNPYQAEKQGPALTVKFSSPGKETVGLTKYSAQAIFAARDSDDFDIIVNVTSFLGRDVDTVHLCNLLNSGLGGSLSVVSSFSNDACKVISEHIQACDAFVNSTVTDTNDVMDHRRQTVELARCPVVANETRVEADKANQVQYHVLFGNRHNGFSLEMVQSLLLGATLVILVICNRKRSKVQTPWKKVPGAKFLLGNLPRDTGKVVEALEQWASLYGQNGIFETNFAGKRFFVLCNEEKAKIVESKRPYKVTKRIGVNTAIDSLGFHGLFSAEGEDWKRERRLVGPALNHGNVKEYLAMVKLVASRLLEKWSRDMKNGVISVNGDVQKCIIDVISLVAFSLDLDSLNGSSEVKDLLAAILPKVCKRSMSPIPYWKIPIIGQHLDGSGSKIQKLNALVMQMIQEFETKSGSLEGNEAEYTKRSKSFLAKVVEMNKRADSPLSTHRMIGNILTMQLAGSETTAEGFCHCLYEIAADKTGLQKELAQEAMEIENFEDADLDTLATGFPRMSSFIYEVLRLRGPVAINSFMSQIPIEIDGIVLPAKSNFLVLYRIISKNGTSAPRGQRDSPPSEFCGRRWLTGSFTSLYANKPTFKTGYRAFGEGVRVCPGRELAETELLVFLVSILRAFELELEPDHPPMSHTFRLSVCQEISTRLLLKPRVA